MSTGTTHPDNNPFEDGNPSSGNAWYFQCTSPECGLRFPAPEIPGLLCPLCRAPLECSEPWRAESTYSPETSTSYVSFSVILDNLRSAYNVGSILRTADGAGFKHAYLCGITPTPSHPRLAKTALSAEIHTAWSHHTNGVHLVSVLKSRGLKIIGLETCPKAVNLFIHKPERDTDIALVVGNEVYGTDPVILNMCDQVVYLPMSGIKKSLNVSVAFGIAAYFLIH